MITIKGLICNKKLNAGLKRDFQDTFHEMAEKLIKLDVSTKYLLWSVKLLI